MEELIPLSKYLLVTYHSWQSMQSKEMQGLRTGTDPQWV